MKVVLLIQARMGSTRLPGKVLKYLRGKTVLARVVERSRCIQNVDQLVVVTTTNPVDQVIVQQCTQLGVSVFQGSEDDVVDRYYQAAIRYEADAIVRITCDCPLIDPAVSSQVVDLFVHQNPDYASNIEPRCFPQGLDTEVFTFKALRTTWEYARQDYERAHVTPYIRERPDQFRKLGLPSDQDFSHLRWTLDTPEDLRFIQAIYERIEDPTEFSWLDVLALMDRQPQLYDINRHIHQKAMQEG